MVVIHKHAGVYSIPAGESLIFFYFNIFISINYQIHSAYPAICDIQHETKKRKKNIIKIFLIFENPKYKGI